MRRNNHTVHTVLETERPQGGLCVASRKTVWMYKYVWQSVLRWCDLVRAESVYSLHVFIIFVVCYILFFNCLSHPLFFSPFYLDRFACILCLLYSSSVFSFFLRVLHSHRLSLPRYKKCANACSTVKRSSAFFVSSCWINLRVFSSVFSNSSELVVV